MAVSIADVLDLSGSRAAMFALTLQHCSGHILAVCLCVHACKSFLMQCYADSMPNAHAASD